VTRIAGLDRARLEQRGWRLAQVPPRDTDGLSTSCRARQHRGLDQSLQVENRIVLRAAKLPQSPEKL
jgi:hypothetical protein